MSAKWYGNIMNRIEEGKMFCDEIQVGTGMTEYDWSDRHAYEVIEVKDQKHVVVRELAHKHIGEAFENTWELYSDESKPCRSMERRGNTWYWTCTITADDIKDIDDDDDLRIRVIVSGFDIDKIREKGKQTKRHKANVSFGVADYYYDYSF